MVEFCDWSEMSIDAGDCPFWEAFGDRSWKLSIGADPVLRDRLWLPPGMGTGTGTGTGTVMKGCSSAGVSCTRSKGAIG